MSDDKSVFNIDPDDQVPDWEKRKRSASASRTSGQQGEKKRSPSPTQQSPAPKTSQKQVPAQKPVSRQQPPSKPTPPPTPDPAPASPPPKRRSAPPSQGLPTAPATSLPTAPAAPQAAPRPTPAPAPAPGLPTSPNLPTIPSSPYREATEEASPPAVPTPDEVPVEVEGSHYVEQGESHSRLDPPPIAASSRKQPSEEEKPARPPVSKPDEKDEDEDEDEDEDFIEDPPPSRRKSSPSNKKGRGGKKTKKKRKSKKKDHDPGNKTRVTIIRTLVLSLLGILVLIGVYNIIFPTQFPGPDQVFDKVQEGLEVTSFPADEGEAFVIGFTRAYLTVPESSSQRAAELENYVPTSLLKEMSTSIGGIEQKIIDGPYVSGVRYDMDSEQDAVFTVASRLDSGYWIYMEIPVYYNPNNLSFAISGVPGIVAQPRLTSVPAKEKGWEEDPDISDDVITYLDTFFKAWSNPESSEELRKIYTTNDANPRALTGLQGVDFLSLSNVVVSQPQIVGGTEDARISNVRVRWQMASPLEEDSSEEEEEETEEGNGPVSFDMDYEVILVKSTEGDQQWKVKDIRGGVRTETKAEVDGNELEDDPEDQEAE